MVERERKGISQDFLQRIDGALGALPHPEPPERDLWV